MDTTGYVRLTIWILMDKQLNKKLDKKGFNRINSRIVCTDMIGFRMYGYDRIR